MEQNGISYLNRTFDDYRESLKEMIATNYPEMANDFNDASIGSWLIDLAAAIGDNLSFHIDSVYSETQIDTAQQANSIMDMARTNGFKIPGPKGAMVELQFSCTLKNGIGEKSTRNNEDYYAVNWYYAPIIKRGTLLKSSNGQYFEVLEDIDFTEAFDENGNPNREIIPNSDVNDAITSYTINKTVMAVAGQSKIYTVSRLNLSREPFFEFTITDRDIIGIDSIIFGVYGDKKTPDISDFFINGEKLSVNGNEIYRFYEVNNLAEQYIWTDDFNFVDKDNKPLKHLYGYYDEKDEKYIPTYSIVKGKWTPLTQKFITEYTDNGYLKITFGSGEEAGHNGNNIEGANSFSKYMMTRMTRNNFLGKTPPSYKDMYILYRVGGGYTSNVPANTINTIASMNIQSRYPILNSADAKAFSEVRDSIRVTNTTASISGKDMPSLEEIKYLIKYNNSEQNRCVTAKDYDMRLDKLPTRYGCPYRHAAIEANNKIMLYLLNIDNNGFLTDVLPSLLTDNIKNYLSMYRCINDYVEIKAGRVINVSFEVDLFVDKNYVIDDVIRNVIYKIRDYMDIDKHHLGEDIFVGDIMKEVGNIDGVLNMIDMRIYNEVGDLYSSTQTSQKVNENEPNRYEIDLEDSDYILYSEADEMFEIKYPSNDIRVRCKLK